VIELRLEHIEEVPLWAWIVMAETGGVEVRSGWLVADIRVKRAGKVIWPLEIAP